MLFRHPNSQAGMALMPLVLTFVIAGSLIGAGMHLLGPKVTQIRVDSTIRLLDNATRSVVAWSVNHGRLPTTAEFVAAAGVRDDAWQNDLVYVYDNNLTTAAGGGLCGREASGIAVNGTTEAAFLILSGGSDFAIDSTPAAPGAFAGNAALSGQDLTRVVSLDELRNRAGCFNRTGGRLVLLNNELPEGCSGEAYRGDLYGEGGVAPYVWSANILPGWLNLASSGAVYRCSGTPGTPGNYPVEVVLTDSVGTSVQRRFAVLVTACASGPAPVSDWDFNEGSGPATDDGTGDNDGTLAEDAGWSADTPDGSGSSLSFDGRGDHVLVNDHSSLHLAGELTLMAWVKETAVGRYAKVVSRRTGSYFYFLGVDRGHPYGGIGDGVSYTVSGKSILMSLDRWNHLAMVYNDDADRMFLHFDGTERMTAVSRSLPPTAGVDLVLGGNSQDASGRFNGDIDNVAIYNRALTDSEIRGLMNGASHPNQVASYGFDGNVEDAGSGSHDGLLTGGSYTADRFGLPNAALRLDGNDSVQIADHPDFQITGGLTLAAWIRERVPGSDAKIISRDSGDYFYFLGVDNGRPYGGIGDGINFTMTRKSIAMIPDQWHFVAFVYDDAADRMQIYFDGTLDETFVAQSLPLVTGVDLTIGADFEGTRYFFTGSIDGVAVYDQALDAAEIRESY
jgi:hypothetical protein